MDISQIRPGMKVCCVNKGSLLFGTSGKVSDSYSKEHYGRNVVVYVNAKVPYPITFLPEELEEILDVPRMTVV